MPKIGIDIGYYNPRKIVPISFTDGSGSGGVPLGTIFTDDFNRASIGTDYYQDGASFSIASNQLQCTNGGGIWNQRLVYNKDGYFSNLEQWTQTIYYNAGSRDGFGISLGGVSGTTFNIQCILFLTTLPGQIRFYSNNGGAVLDTSVSALVINDNDDLKLELTNDRGVITAIATNITTGLDLTFSYTYSLTYPITEFSNSHFYPTIFSNGGTQTNISWSFTSPAVIGAKYCFIGDSITAGYFSNTLSNRFSTLTSGSNSFNVYAGSGNYASNFFVPEIVNLSADNYIICLGTNDVLNAVPTATSMANILSIVTAVEAIGKQVVICQIPPLDSLSVVTYNAALVTNFGSRVGPDLYTLLKGAGTGFAVGKSPDGIHPANTEQQNIANEILLYL